MLRNIKIAVDAPIAAGATDVTHTGTSYQVSKIPDFTDSTYIVLDVVNDTVNLLAIRFEYDMLDTQALYIRTKYHYNLGRESNWSKIMPLRGDQIGIKLSNTIINTPLVTATLNYDRRGSVNINTNDFSLFAGVGAHSSSSYEIIDTDGVVYYSRNKDIDNLTNLTLPLSKFDAGKSYIVKVKHHSDTNTDSNYGKTLLTIDTKTNSLYDLSLPYDLITNRKLWFKLNIYTTKFKSIDVTILDKNGYTVGSNLGQTTGTPYIDPIDLIVGDTYHIVSSITFTDNSKTEQVEDIVRVALPNIIMPVDQGINYLGKHTFSQYINMNGEGVQNSYESYAYGILLGKSNDNHIYRYKMLNGLLYEIESAFTMTNVGTLNKAFVNIIPLHNGSVLIDHADGTTTGNIKEPSFSVYDYNAITQRFTYLHKVIRPDERNSTAVSASAVPMVNGYLYYIPNEELDSDGNNVNLTLRRYDPTSNTYEIVRALPKAIMKYGSLVKIDDNHLMFLGGVGAQPTVGDINDYQRLNNIVYKYTISTNTWSTLRSLPSSIPNSIYNLQAYNRKDGKIVLFNASEVGDSVGNQNTYVYNIATNSITVEYSDTGDNLRYNSSIIYQNGDIGRLSSVAEDPQKLFTYIGNTMPVSDIVDNTIIDTITDLVIKVGDDVTIESPYRYDTITIEGTSSSNTGVLHWIQEDKVVDFYYNDLIVTRTTTLNNTANLTYDSITILDNVVLTANAEVNANEITVGNNSDLIINL